MHEYHINQAARYGMMAAGLLVYLFTVQTTAYYMRPFARPRARIWTIVLTAWLTAGAIACATAAFDHNAAVTIHTALLQSLVLSIGLLYVPRRVGVLPHSGATATTIGFSVPWIVAAVIVSAASMVLLGPGFTMAL